MIVKIHEVKFRNMRETIVCVCDEEHVGKTYSENEKKLFVNERYYGNEKAPVDKIKEVLRKATIMNFIGTDSIKLGVDEGYIDIDNIVEIQKVPHAQVVFMKKFA